MTAEVPVGERPNSVAISSDGSRAVVTNWLSDSITVLRVETEEVYAHCAKAFLRSALWDPDSWPETRPTPSD